MISQYFSSLSQSEWLIIIAIIGLLIVGLLIRLLLLQKNVQNLYHLIIKLDTKTDLLSQNLQASQRDFFEDHKQKIAQLTEFLNQDKTRQIEAVADLKLSLEQRLGNFGQNLNESHTNFKTEIIEKLSKQQKLINQLLNEGLQKTQDLLTNNIRLSIQSIQADLDRNLDKQNKLLNTSITQLTNSTNERLKEISGQVDKGLNEGFEKTAKTFNDVLKRLALIDQAQQKITELSTNVVGLQEILNDKRSRGAFGEVQLLSLISNTMPDSHYTMQYTLSNQKVADCVLELPEPTGKIAIDAKFPLENYRKMMDIEIAESDRKEASKQFAKDIKKHISDIANKYILPPETSDGAVMFIPAESIFAEIHGHHADLIEYAYQNKVWLVSPTTLMAILTTAVAVIKDEKTRQQVHIIKEHLLVLGKDFGRFENRMNNLFKHIGQVTKDVSLVHTSAQKISSRFNKIEKVDLKRDDESQNATGHETLPLIHQ